jgi:hypothetical protein
VFGEQAPDEAFSPGSVHSKISCANNALCGVESLNQLLSTEGNMARKGLIIVGLAIFVGAAFLLLRTGPASPPPTSDPPEERPELRTERPSALHDPSQNSEIGDDQNDETILVDPSPTVILPPFDESDPFVRERLEPFSLPEEWIAQDHLLRRLAVVADNATRGDLSRRQLEFAKPEGRFRVITKDGSLYADPNNARRFDSYLDRLESIDPATLAKLLGTLGPLIDDALEELGSTTSAGDVLRDAIDRILEAPVRIEALELVQGNVLYEYADPDLESLPPLDKQLLRLGPTNLARLKVYLLDLRSPLQEVWELR